MSVLIKQLARFAAQRIAATPQAKEKAVSAARTVVEEAKLIAHDEDRARAAGRSFRRMLNKLQDKS